MFTVILAVVAVLIFAFLVFVALQPPDFSIVRSASVGASAGDVFSHINDFHNWPGWSPWEKLDPGMTRTFEGPGVGPGSIYSWSGNKKVGAGRMTVVDSRPGEYVRIKLDFLRPFPASNDVEFTLKPEGSATAVT